MSKTKPEFPFIPLDTKSFLNLFVLTVKEIPLGNFNKAFLDSLASASVEASQPDIFRLFNFEFNLPITFFFSDETEPDSFLTSPDTPPSLKICFFNESRSIFITDLAISLFVVLSINFTIFFVLK